MPDTRRTSGCDRRLRPATGMRRIGEFADGTGNGATGATRLGPMPVMARTRETHPGPLVGSDSRPDAAEGGESTLHRGADTTIGQRAPSPRTGNLPSPAASDE